MLQVFIRPKYNNPYIACHVGLIGASSNYVIPPYKHNPNRDLLCCMGKLCLLLRSVK